MPDGLKKINKYIDAYMAHLPEMLKNHEGKYTVFAGKEPLGFWDTFESALENGVREYGVVDMLVRKVSSGYMIYGRYYNDKYDPSIDIYVHSIDEYIYSKLSCSPSIKNFTFSYSINNN
jgi:hypothetical protein